MRLGLSLVAIAMITTSTFAADAAYWVYYGCYTGNTPTDSKGITRSRFDPKSGELSKPELVVEIGSPSFLAIHPSKKSLYAVGEGSGGVAAFTLDAKTGSLTKLNNLPSGGAGPCHVSLSPDGKTAVVSNYGGGSCAFYRIAADGSLEKQIAFFQHVGKGGPNKGRQEKAHGHCGMFSPDGKFCYVCDLGLDCVRVYSVGNEVLASGEITLPKGSGPRHISISPKGDWAFVNGELDFTVNVVKLDPAKGTGEVTQSISTLPGGKAVAGNSTAEVLLHPNGKFVYCSNRGHNSIAAFAWDGSKLTAIGHATQGIKVPRNFNIDPTGQWMLVANQDGNDVCVFKIGSDGVPQPTGTTVPTGKPVCIKFVPIIE
jgi:6-phosphogluconolactonase